MMKVYFFNSLLDNLDRNLKLERNLKINSFTDHYSWDHRRKKLRWSIRIMFSLEIKNSNQSI